MDLQKSEEYLKRIKRCIEDASNLSMIDKTALYYLSGYVPRKEGMQCPSDPPSNLPESKFTTLLSRGKLSFLPDALYDLSLYRFHMRNIKYCTKIFIQAFHEIYFYIGYVTSIIRRHVNCFFKSFTKKMSDNIREAKDNWSIKCRRLNDKW